jgi:hypothetical protein
MHETHLELVTQSVVAFGVENNEIKFNFLN